MVPIFETLWQENITSLGITSVVLCLTCLLLLYLKRNYNLPPGPWGLPFFGYYPFLSNKPYLDFARLAKYYGNVFCFRTVGGTLIVVLNGVENIKNVLVNRSDEFIGRPRESNLIAWISDGLGITQEEGEPWKEHRRFFLQTAKTFGFGKQESQTIIHEEINNLLGDVSKSCGKPTDFKIPICYLANSVICQILFSKKFDKYDESFEAIANSASYLVEMFTDKRFMIVGPLYEYIIMKLLPSTKRIREAQQLFRNISREIVEDHIKTYDPNHLRDYIDAYLHHAAKIDKSVNLKDHSFTKKRLCSIILNMIMEGTESVGATIMGLLQEASHHEKEQKLVQDELDTVVGQERLPTLADRPHLPYLEAFIQELHRINMTFKITTEYCNFKETTIAGYRIPSRTVIVSNLWSINFDPKLHPEPTKFNPKRFLDENGKKIKTEGPYPFGIGKRTCIGESLAQMEVFLTIASVLQKFTLYPSENDLLKAVPRKF